MDINQLFFEWVEYLEGGNQKAFCEKTSISVVTVSRIKNQTQKPSKSTIKRLQDIYKISVQDYLAGVEVYERLRKQKEQASLNQYKNLLDPEKASNVYALSSIRSTLKHSKPLGIRFDRLIDTNPKDFIFVYVDKKDEILNFGELVCFCITEKPQIYDLVLIFDKTKTESRIINFKNFTKNHTIFGVLIK